MKVSFDLASPSPIGHLSLSYSSEIHQNNNPTIQCRFGQTCNASNNPKSTNLFGSQIGASNFGGNSTGTGIDTFLPAFGEPYNPGCSTFGQMPTGFAPFVSTPNPSNPFGSRTQPSQPTFGCGFIPSSTSRPTPTQSSPFQNTTQQSQPTFGCGFIPPSTSRPTPTQSSPFQNTTQQSQPTFGYGFIPPCTSRPTLTQSSPFQNTSQQSQPAGTPMRIDFSIGSSAFDQKPVFEVSISMPDQSNPFGRITQKPIFEVSVSTPNPSNPFGSITQPSQPTFRNNMFGSSMPFGATSFPAQSVPFGSTSQPLHSLFGSSTYGSSTPFGFSCTPAFNTTHVSAQSSSNGNIVQPSQPADGRILFGSSVPVGATNSPAFGATSTCAIPTSVGSASLAVDSTETLFDFSSVRSFSSWGGFETSSTPASDSSSSSTFGTMSCPAYSTASTPAFGPTTSTPSVGATSTSAFDSASTPAFGNTSSPAFGPTTSTPSVGATSSPAFDSASTSAFGNTSSPAFGATSNPASDSAIAAWAELLGSSSTPAFGAFKTPSGILNTPSCSLSFPPLPIFGQSTSAFGGNYPFSTSSSPSGAQNSTFGAHSTKPTSGFSPSAFCGQRQGSRVAPYTPTVEQDSTNSSADFHVKFGMLESISAMPTYKHKSHEELRLEDYQLGDKGLLGSSSTPAFGASSTPFGILNTPSCSLSFPPLPSFSQSTSAFGGNYPFGASSSHSGTQNSTFCAHSTIPASGFSLSAFRGQGQGSRVAPYTPTVEQDSTNSSGEFSVKFGMLESISAMPTYKHKSHEELRWEDYQLGDKANLCRNNGREDLSLHCNLVC